jgi:hypothetical protein
MASASTVCLSCDHVERILEETPFDSENSLLSQSKEGRHFQTNNWG